MIQMIKIFSHLFIISSLIIVGAIYFTTFMGIIGKGNTERFPYLGILAVVMAYLIFILIHMTRPLYQMNDGL